MNGNERKPIPEDLRLGAPPTGSAYAAAEAHLQRLKERAEGSEGTGWEPKRPARHGTEDGRLDRLISDAEKSLGYGR